MWPLVKLLLMKLQSSYPQGNVLISFIRSNLIIALLKFCTHNTLEYTYYLASIKNFSSFTCRKPFNLIICYSIGIYVKKVGPFIDKAGHLLNLWFPIAAAFWNKSIALYRSIEKYHPEEYFPMAFGLILAFFGIVCDT